MSVYSDLVARGGLSDAHAALLEAVPAGARVLDVGCATGYLAAELCERGHEVVGVERDPAAAAQARARAGVEVIELDLDLVPIADAVSGRFGAILCGDVLEHLRDPAATLRGLTPLLAPGGLLLVSLPNAAHWTARRSILCGRFPQDDHGLFDRTHLRFFTRATGRELLESAGLRVLAERPVAAPLPLEAHARVPASLRGRAVARWPVLFALQFVFTARLRDDA